ncbi:MAG TPA: hypothetical protein VFN30_01510 [Chitinophagaceae bacterium]|nr:hypothetical protein [Chitinophagaceae bacterium]
MLVRIWTTGIVPGKETEYLNFANEYFIPMFRKQAGLLNVNILIKPGKSLVFTYWENEEDIVSMENNAI